MRHIGPGLILAGAIVGTGELIQTTQLGAQAGFALLWLVIVSCFIKVFVQIELGRFAISTGQTTFGGFRSLPGPGMLLVWWCVLMLLVTQFQIGAMIGGVAQAMHMVVPGASPVPGGRDRRGACLGWFDAGGATGIALGGADFDPDRGVSRHGQLPADRAGNDRDGRRSSRS